jgi:hypothetical protein
MGLNINNFHVDPIRIDLGHNEPRGAKTEQLFQFFASLSVGQSFTLPRKDTAHTRKVFSRWTSVSMLPYELVGRSTSDKDTYRFWVVSRSKKNNG